MYCCMQCLQMYTFYMGPCIYLHVYCSRNIGKYQVSVKHTTVSILIFCYFLLVHTVDPPVLACLFYVYLYRIACVISPCGFQQKSVTLLMVHRLKSTFNTCMWATDTGFGSHSDQKRPRSPSSAVLDVHFTVSVVARIISTDLGMRRRDTRVFSSYLSTQLRRAQT